MLVVHVASEVAPFSKTGGLADVTGSLPEAVASAGVEVVVVSPAYPSVRKVDVRFNVVADLSTLDLCPARAGEPVALLEARRIGVRYLFVDCPGFFGRTGLYGDADGDYPDNAERFLLLCRAAIAGVDRLSLRPDIFHCHDWQSGPLPILVRTGGLTAATIFTIHNLGYQGNFPADVFPKLSIPASYWSPEHVEYFGQVSFLKAALVHADRLTTVSPTYAREIQEPELGFGMDPILRSRREVLSGILNGIDTNCWNPAADPHLAEPYSPDRPAGKTADRRSLDRELGLDPGGPLFVVVSRLAGQKGINLVIDEIPRLVALDARICILGTGQPEYHERLEELARSNPGRLAAVLAFNEQLAHRMYAAGDFFLMPSEYEPCGLGQMIALRYGTLPVAARTGGLADTVFEVGEEGGNGFVFERGDARGFSAAIDRALMLFARPTELARVRERGMRTDFSWDARARDYLELYRRFAPVAPGRRGAAPAARGEGERHQDFGPDSRR
ncbi:MAG: glycogen synthase GlgA [bacterium]